VKIALFLLFVITQLSSLQLVDTHIERGEIDKALNRLFHLAKDEKNFRCLEVLPCISAEDVDKRVQKLIILTNDELEKEIIGNFFNELGTEDNSFLVAYNALKDEKYFEAYDRYKSLSSIYPSNPNLLKDLGKSAVKIGKYRESEQAYRELIEFDPNSIDSYIQLAGIYYKLEEFDKAKEVLDKAKRIDPKNERVEKLQKEVESSDSIVAKIFDDRDGDEVDGILEEEESEEDTLIPWSGELVDSNDSFLLPPLEAVAETEEDKEKRYEEIGDELEDFGDRAEDLKYEMESEREEQREEMIDTRKDSKEWKLLFEINRILDDTISNLKEMPFLVSEQLSGISGIEPKNYETSHIVPNLYVDFPFSSMRFGMNIYSRQYLKDDENDGYTLITPFLNLYENNETKFGIGGSYLMVDGESVMSPSVYGSVSVLNTLLKMVYKMNTYSENSDMSHDSLLFSGEYSFQNLLFADKLRLKYVLLMSSLAMSSEDEFEDISQYMSNMLGVNYLITPIANLDIESGLSYEMRTYGGEREDNQISLFGMVQYTMWRYHKLATLLKMVQNSSNVDAWEYDETLLGMNYKFVF
jgi:tetratricopeptide (TPR) repeat protein